MQSDIVCRSNKTELYSTIYYIANDYIVCNYVIYKS